MGYICGSSEFYVIKGLMKIYISFAVSGKVPVRHEQERSKENMYVRFISINVPKGVRILEGSMLLHDVLCISVSHKMVTSLPRLLFHKCMLSEVSHVYLSLTLCNAHMFIGSLWVCTGT